jgi:hypothetical protein
MSYFGCDKYDHGALETLRSGGEHTSQLYVRHLRFDRPRRSRYVPSLSCSSCNLPVDLSNPSNYPAPTQFPVIGISQQHANLGLIDCTKSQRVRRLRPECHLQSENPNSLGDSNNGKRGTVGVQTPCTTLHPFVEAQDDGLMIGVSQCHKNQLF